MFGTCYINQKETGFKNNIGKFNLQYFKPLTWVSKASVPKQVRLIQQSDKAK